MGKNKLFGDISNVFWVSKINLSEEREDVIRESFDDQEVHFSYPQNVEDFNYLIGNFMQTKAEYINSERGRKWRLLDLLSWTSYLDLLTSLTVFRISWQCPESMVFRAFMSFIRFIQTDKTGK